MDLCVTGYGPLRDWPQRCLLGTMGNSALDYPAKEEMEGVPHIIGPWLGPSLKDETRPPDGLSQYQGEGLAHGLANAKW